MDTSRKHSGAASENAAAGPELPDPSARQQRLRVTARIYGSVQGVGFRYWTARQARALGLEGLAANQSDGSVEVVAEGPRAQLEDLVTRLSSGHTPGHIERVETDYSAATGEFSGFSTS